MRVSAQGAEEHLCVTVSAYSTSPVPIGDMGVTVLCTMHHICNLVNSFAGHHTASLNRFH